jgi:hypothetical protein
VADLNGDGKADLAVTNAYGGSVSVFLGNGNGTFQNAMNLPTGDGPYSVQAADCTAPQKLDHQRAFRRAEPESRSPRGMLMDLALSATQE